MTEYPKCPNPLCPGHIGKFDSCFDEALYEMTLDMSYVDQSTGDAIDWNGYYSLILAHPEPYEWKFEDGSGRVEVIPANKAFIVEAMPQGFINVVSYDTDLEAKEVFDTIDAEFWAWEQEGEGEEE